MSCPCFMISNKSLCPFGLAPILIYIAVNFLGRWNRLIVFGFDGILQLTWNRKQSYWRQSSWLDIGPIGIDQIDQRAFLSNRIYSKPIKKELCNSPIGNHLASHNRVTFSACGHWKGPKIWRWTARPACPQDKVCDWSFSNMISRYLDISTYTWYGCL